MPPLWYIIFPGAPFHHFSLLQHFVKLLFKLIHFYIFFYIPSIHKTRQLKNTQRVSLNKSYCSVQCAYHHPFFVPSLKQNFSTDCYLTTKGNNAGIFAHRRASTNKTNITDVNETSCRKKHASSFFLSVVSSHKCALLFSYLFPTKKCINENQHEKKRSEASQSTLDSFLLSLSSTT